MLARQRKRNPRYAVAVEFLGETGLRSGELCAPRVSDLRMNGLPEVRITKSKSDGYAEKEPKNGRSRSVPLSDRALSTALRVRADKPENAILFDTPSGTFMHSANVRRALNRDETAYGHRPHDLRHKAATMRVLGTHRDTCTVSVTCPESFAVRDNDEGPQNNGKYRKLTGVGPTGFEPMTSTV
jgi:integrase